VPDVSRQRSHISFMLAIPLYIYNHKCEAIPVEPWAGPEGSRKLRPQISRYSAHEGGKVVNPRH
jgi:hypothetical protein